MDEISRPLSHMKLRSLKAKTNIDKLAASANAETDIGGRVPTDIGDHADIHTDAHTDSRADSADSETDAGIGHECGVAPDVPGQLQQFRRTLLRYQSQLQRLPYRTRATCPTCGQQVDAEFVRKADCDADRGADCATNSGIDHNTDHTAGRYAELLLRYDCRRCGSSIQRHHDTIWSAAPPDRTGSATRTCAGHLIKPNARKLPRTVQTLCPECSAVIVGRYFVEDDAVLIEKNCPEHGYFRDIINRDVKLYFKAAYWSFAEQSGLTNPAAPGDTICPADCGLCGRHQSGPCLANLDLTNRCNLNCPICFANANAVGYVYEPDFEQVVAMMQSLRDLRPTPATAIQFSGGEPTLHPHFHDIIGRAAAMGFSNIQIATNGLKMADYDFARRARDAGLHTLYLQFDGVGPDIYRTTRGRDIWPDKLQALENCHRLDLKVCLVPTIIKTVNDDQVGAIFNFAVENIDVVSGISYQPVCFSGRIDTRQRLQQRYTLGDLAHDIAAASGAVVERDFYPLSIILPLAQLLESVSGDPKIKPSCHTDCAFGSYFLISPEKKVYPFPAVLDIEAMFVGMDRLARKFARHPGRLGPLDNLAMLRLFKKVFRPERAPAGLDIAGLRAAMAGMVDKNKGRGTSGGNNYRTLMAAGMHFQDCYNYDVERVKRCVIPYATPAGIFPFCAYNSGPAYRSFVERLFAR